MHGFKVCKSINGMNIYLKHYKQGKLYRYSHFSIIQYNSFFDEKKSRYIFLDFIILIYMQHRESLICKQILKYSHTNFQMEWLLNRNLTRTSWISNQLLIIWYIIKLNSHDLYLYWCSNLYELIINYYFVFYTYLKHIKSVLI